MRTRNVVLNSIELLGSKILISHHRQMFSHLQGSRASSALSYVVVTWEDKTPHPSSFCPQVYMPSMMPYGYKIPCICWSQMSWFCPLPTPCSHSTRLLVGGRGGWEAEKALTLPRVCSAITKTSLLVLQCFQQKSKPQPATLKNINSTLAQTSISIYMFCFQIA